MALGERRGAEVRQPSRESARFFILGNKVRARGLLRINIDRSAKELRHCPKKSFFLTAADLIYCKQLVPYKKKGSGVGAGWL